MLIEGPAGTGKSRAVLEKVNRWMLRCPGARALVVRKTRASLSESTLVTYEEKVVPANDPDFHPDVRATLRRVRQSYEYPNGSSLVVGGIDNADRIMSTEFDLIAAFEATELTEDDWEKLTTRLRNGVMPFQQAIADCNPAAPTHWLNQRANAGRMARLLSRHEDNPGLYDGRGGWTDRGRTYLARLDALTGPRHARLRAGKWAAAEGLVYQDWDAAVHVVDRFDVPREWRRVRAVDFGFVNPAVCQFWAIDHDGRMYLYREIYHTGMLVEDFAAVIKAASGAERFEATISDHDAEDRATLHKHGVPTVPANKSVMTGIEAVQARLRNAGDGKPRLFVMRDSLVRRDAKLAEAKLPTCTIEELDSYVWARPPDGRPPKEEPTKLNDHGADAMRYACMYQPARRTPGRVGMMDW